MKFCISYTSELDKLQMESWGDGHSLEQNTQHSYPLRRIFSFIVDMDPIQANTR